MNILIFGGTGFIGAHLSTLFSKQGHDVTIVSRRELSVTLPNAKAMTYTPANLQEIFALQPSDYAVINLAGEPLQKGRWTESRKEAILKSRTSLTEAIRQAISQTENKPRVWINASAIGYYGTSLTKDFTESAPAGDDFLAHVCQAWEETTKEAQIHTRVVNLRIGVVLGQDGGALPKMMLPYRMMIGGKIGSGEQWVSWIHIEDLSQLFLHVLCHEEIKGAINGVAPTPVRMKGFSQQLAKAMHRPNWIPVPSFALRILFGEMAMLLLEGQRVTPKVAIDSGFRYRYPLLDEALQNLLS